MGNCPVALLAAALLSNNKQVRPSHWL